MLQNTAQSQIPEKVQITDVDAAKQKIVNNISQQVNDLNQTPNGTYSAQPHFDTPIQVPLTGATVVDDKGNKQVPPTHRSNKFFDNMEHYKPEGVESLLTGEDEPSAPVRLDTSKKGVDEVKKRDAAAMQEKNNPTPEKQGVLEKFNDWMHK